LVPDRNATGALASNAPAISVPTNTFLPIIRRRNRSARRAARTYVDAAVATKGTTRRCDDQYPLYPSPTDREIFAAAA
jgi:hypothetical protein